MLQDASTDAIAAASGELEVRIASTQEQIRQAQRLRYVVYCLERGFEPGENGLEQDEFDNLAKHVLVRSRQTGNILGTVRIVLPAPGAGHDGFPMQRACADYVLAPLPVAATGEISRFALTRERFGVSPAAAALMRLCLMRGIVEISGQAGLTHWCAIMERSLLRLLRATSIHFQAVGPLVEYHGIRQPTVAAIGTILGRICREQPAVWSFITDNGKFWSDQMIIAEKVVRTASV